MQTFQRFDWTKLWMLEFTLIVIFILDKILKYNPEALHVAKTYAVANAFRAQLTQITAQERANKLSAEIGTADNERDALFAAIGKTAATWALLPLAAQSSDGALVLAVCKKHDVDVNANYLLETEQLNSFIADVDAQPNVLAALERMAMLPAYEALKTANARVAALYVQRSDDRAAKVIDARSIRNECTKAIKTLLNGVEAAANEYDNPDYAKLIGELNELMSSIRTQLNARAARRKAGEKVEEEKPIAIEN